MISIVDLPERQIEVLRIVGEREELSRAELMRRAVAEYPARPRRRRSDCGASTAQTGCATGIESAGSGMSSCRVDKRGTSTRSTVVVASCRVDKRRAGKH